MKNKIIFTLTFALLTGCSTAIEHMVIPDADPGWKMGYQHRERFTNSTIREFIPENDNINNWSKLITIQFIAGATNSPTDLSDLLIKDIKKTCTDATSDIIEKDRNSIIYEWSASICTPPVGTKIDPNIHTAQYEITRIIKGKDGIHKASYAEKTSSIDKNTRARWINKFKKTTLEKDGQVVSPL